MFYGFLPVFLKGESATDDNQIYKDYFIQAVFGVPGSLAGYFLVNNRFLGRRYSIALSALGTGVFIFLFKTTKNGTWQLVFNCISNFLSNLMYGVIYTYTPEVFPTTVRGTAVGIASSLSRVISIAIPFLTGVLMDKYGTNFPLFISAGLFGATGIAAFLLPFETRGTDAQ